MNSGLYQLVTCDTTGLVSRQCTDSFCSQNCQIITNLTFSQLDTCVLGSNMDNSSLPSFMYVSCVSAAVPSFPVDTSVQWYFNGGKNCSEADRLDYALGVTVNQCTSNPSGSGFIKYSCINADFSGKAMFDRYYSDSSCSSSSFTSSSLQHYTQVDACMFMDTQMKTCGTFTPFVPTPSTWIVENAYTSNTCSNSSYAGLWAISNDYCTVFNGFFPVGSKMGI